MSALGLQGASYLTARYPIGTVSRNKMRNVFGQSGVSESSSSTPGGNYHGTLKMGYLHSEFSPVSGQELHMKYDESSTDDDPVMYVEGKDIRGKSFTRKIHLNDVNAENATPAEMTALRVHLAQQDDKSVKASSGIPLMALGSHQDVNASMDFKQYYENWASNLENAGLKQNASIYRSEMERYLFYQRTKGVTFSDTDDASSATTKPTGRLDDEDYDYLSSNWNPPNMSRKDYDEFLDFLQSKGIISEEDKDYAKGIRQCTGEPETWYSPLEPVHDFLDGNVLAFLRYESSLIYDHETTETKHGIALSKKITSIMEEMVKRRGDN